MNNFFLNQDPLLPQQPIYQQPMYIQDPNQQPVIRDWVGDLDKQLKGLDQATTDALNQDSSFLELNAALQTTIQSEIMNLVRSRLNMYPEVADNVKKQMEIIKRTTNKTKEDERKSLSELNDYMKNYSHLSFDEYRKIKQGGYETGCAQTQN